MPITKIFSLFCVFNLLLMITSFIYNPAILSAVVMVMYISILITVGSFIGEKYSKIKISMITADYKKTLVVAVVLSIAIFSLKVYLYGNDIDMTSYTTIRTSFLLKSFGLNGLALQSTLWLGLISAGVCSRQLGVSNLDRSSIVICFLILVAVLLAIFITGSRSSILLFFTAYLTASVSLKEIMKPKVGWGILIISIFIVFLSVIRGVSLNHILIPYDSFIVGPHLLHQNIDVISGQTIYLHNKFDAPIGYALFSGFYVAISSIMAYFDIDVFKNHLEVIFWKRHHFDYIPVFDNVYNSYYTAGLAVAIEGWLKIGLLSLFLGMCPHFIQNTFSKIVVLSLLYLFAFSLFRNSIFHNTSMALFFVSLIMLEVVAILIRLMNRYSHNFNLFKKI